MAELRTFLHALFHTPASRTAFTIVTCNKAS